MALIKCKECGKEISEDARECPYCGCPKYSIKMGKNGKRIIIIIGIILLIALIISFVYYEIARKKAEEAGLPTTFNRTDRHGVIIFY